MVNGRSKGNRAERALAAKFEAWWGSEFARTPMSGGFHTAKFRNEFNAAGDLVTPDIAFPFCVESKNQEGWHLEQLLTSPKCDIYKWWTQTVNETPPNKIPLLVFTRNRQPDYFMIRLTDIPHYISQRLPTPRMALLSHGEVLVIGLLSQLFIFSKKEWLDALEAQNTHAPSCRALPGDTSCLCDPGDD